MNALDDYTRLGAALRRQELLAELALIYRTYPHLRSPKGAAAVLKGRVTTNWAAATAVVAAGPKRRSWRLSPAQRRAISDRMKKTWASRRHKKS